MSDFQAISMNIAGAQGAHWAKRTRIGVVLGANAALWLLLAAAVRLVF